MIVKVKTSALLLFCVFAIAVAGGFFIFSKIKGGAFKEENLSASLTRAGAILYLSPKSLSLGDVSQKKGVVSALFSLENKGTSDLTIYKLETSCGCTTASIIFNGKEGPRFGMPGHGFNESAGKWRLNIPAGQTAQLKVYYDPDVHATFRGAATRLISVFSSDSTDFEKSVRIDLTQID